MLEIGKTCVGSQIERDNYKIKICQANVTCQLYSLLNLGVIKNSLENNL